ncbi:hypothetical protein AAMO2058_001614400 [Amorphochlora amoebiformis]
MSATHPENVRCYAPGARPVNWQRYLRAAYFPARLKKRTERFRHVHPWVGLWWNGLLARNGDTQETVADTSKGIPRHYCLLPKKRKGMGTCQSLFGGRDYELVALASTSHPPSISQEDQLERGMNIQNSYLQRYPEKLYSCRNFGSFDI